MGSPFRHRAFTVMWIATVVANIGGWMYGAASSWLMTSLDPNAFIVSMLTNYLEKKVGMDVCSSNIRVVLPNMISLARA